ncbi:NRAMP family divalent metal transporter [Halococcus thailandensis]|uniref:Mn2+ and Fe2+ transporter-like protein n=1 Tax=Halococcus thailandensis JCM 13552 TaxID=1227457 RepID=M0NFU5_9EURY|nr:divalent metal cation transporter [Halococcus thailandensis]EMA56857.1 Mn2+ and Fe2+ transporter-like protein [Halococcus thailandensis JCM 13552]
MSGTGRGSFADQLRTSVSEFFAQYGVAFVMVASVVGSGSIFIATDAGVKYGYSLIWAFVGAGLLGIMAQDMSARLGIFGEPLMVFIRKKLGGRLAMLLAGVISIGAVLWTIELVAATAKGVSVLLGGAIGWQPLSVVVTVLAVLAGIANYDGVERLLTAMLVVLLGLYLLVVGGTSPDLGAVASGFVPSLPDAGALTLAASIVGSTAIWSNFFLESNLVERKGWTDVSDVPTMRTDLVIGYALAIALIMAIVVVSATVLRPTGVEEVRSFVAPGLALAQPVGQWAAVLFLIGTAAAAFNSIVPIMWVPAYLFEHARGNDANPDNRSFKLLYVVGTSVGVLAPVIASLTGMSVVEMIITFPAYNGIISLPITTILLFWAVNDENTMGEYTNGLVANAINLVLVVLVFALAATSLPGVFGALLPS